MKKEPFQEAKCPAEPPPPKTAPFVLTDEVEGCRCTYLLHAGSNYIGRLPTCDIVLAPCEISRRHAKLIVGPEGLRVEDLGSSNGTFVNGDRVGQSPVVVGNRIGFGPVTLELEDLGSLDGELAAALPPRKQRSGPEESAVTAIYKRACPPAQPSPMDSRLSLLGEFLDRIPGERREDLVPALAHLASTLGVRGLALVEFPSEGEVVLFSGFGDFDLEPFAAQLLPGAPPQGGRLRWIETETRRGVRLTLTVLWPACGEALGLAVWGDLPPRSEIEPFLRTLLLLVVRLHSARRRAPGSGAGPVGAGLVFAPGHLRCASSAMQVLYAQMAAVAASELPLLVVGETGVGKEGVARALHLSSTRREGPIVAVNCAAIPAELLEAELFGIEKGAATGIRPRPGKFRLATGGTLFLDEIGDMSPELQAKLLRALQEQEIEPVGNGGPVAVDVRVVAATNTHLEKRMAAGSFRRDLYYRLAGSVLRVPPLRERREDIPALVEHFLRAACHESGKMIQGLTVGAVRWLAERPWSGNVRELEHEVHRLVCLCPEGAAIVTSMVGEPPAAVEALASVSAEESTAEMAEFAPEPRGVGTTLSAPGGLPSLDLGTLERLAIEEALVRSVGNQTRAARLLGIGRTALYRRLVRYRLTRPSSLLRP